MRLFHADNLAALQQLEAEGVAVDLAYLDPPFFTGRTFEMPDGRVAFEDRWPDRMTYIEDLGCRLRLVHRLLSPHGCLVVHVDPRVSHWVRTKCDWLFGDESFASEIVWRYRRWPAKTENFQAMHDVLLRYRKDPNTRPRWNQLYEPQAPSTLETWGTKRQRAVIKGGRRKRSSISEDESPGVPLSDVWDIGIIAPVAKERTGYPTQKPEALLERLILSLTNRGDTVLDPYMGSGTTLAVAMRHERLAIGIDASAVAVEVARARLGLKAA